MNHSFSSFSTCDLSCNDLEVIIGSEFFLTRYAFGWFSPSLKLFFAGLKFHLLLEDSTKVPFMRHRAALPLLYSLPQS